MKKLYSTYFKVIAFFLATIVKLNKVSQNNKKEQILIIKPDAVGDFFVFLQFIHNIREFYPKEKFNIRIVVNDINLEIAKKYLDIDEVISFNRSKLYSSSSYFFSFISKIKGTYNEIIYPCYSRESLFDIVIYSLHASRKSTFNGDYTNSSKALIHLGNKFYNNLIAEIDPNELTRIDSFLQQVIPNYTYTDFVIKGDPNDPLLSEIKENTIGIFPGASWRGRSWNPNKYSKLIETLISKEFKVLILGGPTDLKITQEILDNCNSRHQVINLVGKSSLVSLTNIISKVDLLITSESCAVHIAQVTKTNSITLLGGGHFERFLPFPVKYNKEFNSKVIYKRLECFYCSWDCPFYIEGHSVPCIDQIELMPIIKQIEKINA